MSPSVKKPETELRAFSCTGCGKGLRARTALIGKKVKCPKCGVHVVVPGAPVEAEIIEVVPEPEAKPRRFSILAMIVVTTVIFGCAIWANLSFAVKNPVHFQYFPPFKKYWNGNDNHHLGAEYYNIAKAMVAGDGFANPFAEKTGPTAWMPPVLPTLTAALLWISGGDKDVVMAIVVFLQVYTLLGSGVLVLLLVRDTMTRMWGVVAAVAFLIAALSDFHQWFQHTHDCWIILAALDLVIAGFAWGRPLASKKRAALWGVFGGLCAMTNPIVGLCWAVLSFVGMFRARAWKPLVIAALLSMLTVSPWLVRNWLVFGRFIPIKSNVAYELWQSQRKHEDGMLKGGSFNGHPYGSPGIERRTYQQMGEMAFLDKKKELFMSMVRDDPLDFADRVANRFFGATLWYTPFNRSDVSQRPWMTWTCRLLHPLPFLAALALLYSAFLRPLNWIQVVVIGIYFGYLMPYVGVSYYDRYAVPLLAVKVLLVLWAADRLLALLFRDPVVQPASMPATAEQGDAHESN